MWETARISKDMSISVGHEDWDQIIGLIGPVGQVNDVLMWIENIVTLIAAFLDLFRNKDDLVKKCSFGYNRDYIASMTPHYVLVKWDFNGGGGGHHEVLIKFLPKFDML